MPDHTPGPWEIRRHTGINGAHIFAPGDGSVGGGLTVAKLTRAADKSIDQKEADGRLIAAAPDLLKALKAAVQDCPCSLRDRDSGHHVDCFAPNALEVIAKAEEKEPAHA